MIELYAGAALFAAFVLVLAGYVFVGARNIRKNGYRGAV